MSMCSAYFRLLRPKDYLKNFFVLLPVFFGGGLLDPSRVSVALLAFCVFCLAASAAYVMNDILDRNEDRNHPVKCTRPVASGEVNPSAAGTLGLALVSAAIWLAWSWGFLVPVVAYLALNAAYSTFAKHISIIDVACVALGFVLRTIAGSEATHYAFSPWLVMMVFLLALFLVLGKRWDDLSVLEHNPGGGRVRRCTGQYSKPFLVAAITLLATANTVCYAMYTMSLEVQSRFASDKIYFSLFWVIIGNLRYLQIILVQDDSGSPTHVLLRDTFIQITVLCWVLHLGLLIYLK